MSRLVTVVGAPSPRLYAMMNIVRALTQVSVGDHRVIVANSISTVREQFKVEGARVHSQPVVLFSDYPDPKMLEALYRLDAPVAVCPDDFTTIAHFSVVARGFGGVEAVRFATMGLVNLEPILISPPPLSLVVRDLDVTLPVLIRDLATLYKLPLNDSLLENVLAFVTVSGRTTLRQYVAGSQPSFADARNRLAQRSPLENDLIDFLAPHYDEIAHGQPLNDLEWPVYALLRPEFPDRLTIGAIDLTGPARHIHYGPYFALPAGVWNVDMSIEVQDCLSDNQIAVDAFSERILAMVSMKLPARGVYGCQIRFEVVDSNKPVEIRVQLLTGAIEGVIQVRGIRLRRIASLDEVV